MIVKIRRDLAQLLRIGAQRLDPAPTVLRDGAAWIIYTPKGIPLAHISPGEEA